MDRSNISKITQDADEQLLLAKLWDKINTGIARNIPANTCFLTPAEQNSARYLFGSDECLCFFGGTGTAERKMVIYLPDYLDGTYLYGNDSPIACIHAEFYREDRPTHRNFLGALTGEGIARECIGDIQVGENYCNFFVQRDVAPFILNNIKDVGRIHVSLTQIPLTDVVPLQSHTEEKSLTVSSLRLDCIAAGGFNISRSSACAYIECGKVSIDGIPCQKSQKLLHENMQISIRGLGKIKIKSIGGVTRKGRTSVTIEVYK